MEEKLCLGGIKEQQFELESEEEEEEEYEKLDELKSPAFANWFKRGSLRGLLVIDDDALMLFDSSKSKSESNVDHYKKKRKRNGFDNNNHTCCEIYNECPICFQPWSTDGIHHQLCSLPCGHIYGRSCINKSLQQEDRSSFGKCPQCNNKCTSEDVRPLYGTRLSIAKHKKASSYTTSATRHFRFTKKGYKAFKKYVLQRQSVALRLQSVASNRHADLLRRAKEATDQLYILEKQRDELLKCQTGAEELQADVLQQRLKALERHESPLALRADALEQRAYAMGQQVRAFTRLSDGYISCIDHYEEMCRRLKLDAIIV
ncbi:zinc finger, RING/FYVE/PHD-type containing protein [Tanacetum coccineum]|uniref:Zinc finger, RING/FYVE/PHD-type containing protein n=1 Tax=Tanacetum coccineum TaxID=301880 RepID=A0ABQ5IDK9_9ASTR